MPYSKIIHTKSEVVGAIPAVNSISYGEIAVNYTDGNLYIKKSNDVIEKIASTAHDKNITDLQSDIFVIKGEIDYNRVTLQQEMRTSDDITSNTNVGGINIGDVVPAESTLQDFLDLLLDKIYDPTLVAPSITLTASSNKVEVGTNTYTLTANFDRGEIVGDIDINNGQWDPQLVQDFRSGAVSTYEFFHEGSSIISGPPNVHNVQGITIDDGNNAFSVTANYVEGPQPTNSKGENFDGPLPAGQISATRNITGARNAFYGNTTSAPASSANVRGLASSKLDPASGTTFTVNAAAGDVAVAFAYPQSLGNVSNVLHVESNFDVKSSFVLSTVTVEGLNGYTGILYNVYYFEPVGGWSGTATYTITI